MSLAARVIRVLGDRGAFYLDDAVTPSGFWGTADPPGVVNTAALIFQSDGVGGEGVVLVDQAAAEALGVWRKGKTPDPGDEAMKAWPGLTAIRQAGWKVAGLAPWMSLHGNPKFPGCRIRLGVLPWIDPDAMAGMMPAADALTLAENLGLFHHYTGVAFHTHPGVVGLSLLRDVTGRRLQTEPFWRPNLAEWPAGTQGCEGDYLWESPGGGWPAGRYVHAYDARRAYLAAAGAVELAHGQLTYHRSPAYSPHLGGYWQIPRPAFNDPNMPHPCGYSGDSRPGGLQWVTTPTMKLLSDLNDEGRIEMPRPLSGYLGGVREFDKGLPVSRILRAWAERLNTAAMDAAGQGELAVAKAVKLVYASAIGQLATEAGRVCRPDWRHSVIALTRANLWRKMWRVGIEESRWPESVHIDSLRYSSDDPDPVSACPRSLVIGERLGQFSVEMTRDRGPAAAEGAQGV